MGRVQRLRRLMADEGLDAVVLNMVISLDCLYFGGGLPCHMENVYIVGNDGAECTYATPLELLGPR